MVTIHYNDQLIPINSNESVLDALNNHGAEIPFSCRSGLCQCCLMQAVEGIPPPSSQEGLKENLKLDNFFLACSCYPNNNLHVKLPGTNTGIPNLEATVHSLTPLNHEIMEVVLNCHTPINYHPGQFIHLFKDEQNFRSYSLASVPEQDHHLHLHVGHLPDGHISTWIHQELQIGQTVTIRGPFGSCFYSPTQAEQNILLIGTGTGLAPLYGILRDALQQEHQGKIYLFHGSGTTTGLYLENELDQLQHKHPNFHYLPCISGAEVINGYAKGRADDLAFQSLNNLKDWRVYLCGHPDMVVSAKRKAFLSGASMQDIYTDAFTPFTT